MTRINAGIKPRELPDKLLLAEHREIKRIPNTISSGKARIEGIPDKFTLGKGHVKFFYDKLFYLQRRYIAIRNECYKRGFNITDYEEAWDFDSNPIPPGLYNDWVPNKKVRRLLIERINSKGFTLK